MQKISFTTLSTPGLDVPAVARLARRFGYDGVDLRVSARAGEILPGTDRTALIATSRILSDEGVELAGLLGYLDYQFQTSQQLADSLREQMEQLLEYAGISGAASVRIGGARSDDRPYTDELGAALEQVLGQACGTDIVIQNHVDAFSAAECLGLVKALNHPRFTLAFSPDHCVIMDEDIRLIYPELAGRVRKLFVSDIMPMGNGHETVMPGQGVVPFVQSYEAAGGQEYDGWITFKYEQFWEPRLAKPEVSLPYFIQRAPQWFTSWHAKADDNAEREREYGI